MTRRVKRRGQIGSMLNIRIDDKGTLGMARQILSDYPKAMHRAISRSIIDTAKATKAEVNRQLLSRYEISRANLKRSYEVKVITPKSMGETDKGGLLITGRRIPIIRFSHIPEDVPPQQGIPIAARQILSTVVVRGQAVVGRPNRFLARMASGHLGVFHRTGQKTKSGKGQISEEYRVSVPEMVCSKAIAPKVQKQASETLQKRVLHNVEQELKKLHHK